MLRKKSAALLISLALLLTLAVGGTVAFLLTSTGPVTNEFTPAEVPIEVLEDFDFETKSNVSIKNKGNAPAYIRASVVFTWVNGNGEVYHTAPVASQDYTITWTKDGWTEGTDGYYYYTNRVAGGGKTGILLTDCEEKDGKAPAGYSLSVEILAQSIQARGEDDAGNKPAELAWKNVEVNDNGTLTVN